jgi:DnaJ-class molecular chaperone
MDKNKNYYQILGVTHDDDSNKIKKAYYKLSFSNHPDKGGDAIIFTEMTEAYDTLYNEETRNEYDIKSKFGRNYNEYYELFDINVDFSYDDGKDKFEKFKKFEIHNIQVDVDDSFNGSLEYERWVKCKSCDGTGKDLSSKIVIRDNDGNVVKTFDADDGCDFCEGSGKDWVGNSCHFCSGKGKVGLTPCKNCNGEKRILGKQKLSGIKLTGNETKIDAMGHFSKDGVVGYLLITKK